jgi:hypothetical protein
LERMGKLGALDKLSEIKPPRDWSTGMYGGPRRIVLEQIADIEVQKEKKDS